MRDITIQTPSSAWSRRAPTPYTRSSAFAAWMRSVDHQLVAICGCDSSELDAWDWYRAFRNRAHPLDAVKQWRADMLREHGVGSHG